MDIVWLRHRLKELVLTQRHLANALGRETSGGNRMVNGKRRLKMEEVPAVADLLKVSRAEMLRRAGLDVEGAEAKSQPTADVAPSNESSETVADLVDQLTNLDVRSIRAIREFLIGEKPVQGRAKKELIALDEKAMAYRAALRERVERAE